MLFVVGARGGLNKGPPYENVVLTKNAFGVANPTLMSGYLRGPGAQACPTSQTSNRYRSAPDAGSQRQEFNTHLQSRKADRTGDVEFAVGRIRN